MFDTLYLSFCILNKTKVKYNYYVVNFMITISQVTKTCK